MSGFSIFKYDKIARYEKEQLTYYVYGTTRVTEPVELVLSFIKYVVIRSKRILYFQVTHERYVSYSIPRVNFITLMCVSMIVLLLQN